MNEEHGGINLTERQWQELGRRVVDKNVLSNQSMLVDEKIIGGNPEVLDDAVNYGIPDDLDRWSISECLEWLEDHGVDRYSWPGEWEDAKEMNGLDLSFMEELAEALQIGFDKDELEEEDDALNFLAEKIVEWSDRGSKRNMEALEALLIVHIEDWATDEYGWRGAVQDNWEYPEVYEWYLCSDWWLREMKDIGEVVLETEWESWWGRCTTGQSIYMDNQLRPVFAKLYRYPQYSEGLEEYE